jgi:cyclase
VVKIRVMPTMLYRDLTLVKGVGFDSWRRVGSVMQQIKVYNLREVDELVFVDITASLDGRSPDFALVDDFADECFMPLAVGGGIAEVGDIRKLLEVGADKVVINSALVSAPGLVTEGANAFGSQAIVGSIDYRRHADGKLEAFTHSGTSATGLSPLELAKRAEALGAGEVILTSIDRDGTLSGYDIEVLAEVSDELTIPVIASGGAGNYADMERVILEAGVSAVAAASMFHFTEQTPLMAKRHLASRGISVRL